ncbi:hypothetical protein [Acetobacter sp. AAB5]|uniref:hypothetical protein n=1 Tax=Acetobacter sp. AAB5 TaxID=3418370 RepID=UPI003CED4D79
MIPKPLRPFIMRLLQATGDNELKWNEGADDAYFATRKNADLHIRYFFDSDTGEGGYTFRILRGDGDAFFTVSNNEDDYYLMRDLYSAISVNAAGGGQIVSGLFD